MTDTARHLDLPDDADLVVELTPMRRRHLRQVLRIEAQNPHRPWSLGLFMSELALRTSRVYTVARVDGLVVGFAGVLFSGADGHITTIAVDPVFRRRGIATRMLVLLAQRSVQHGATNLTLEVRASNDAAQGLYGRFGFETAGRRTNYYSDLGEDALVMWATGIDTPGYGARLSALASEVPGGTVEQGWDR